MDVLVLDLFGERVRHIHVVELLGVHIEQISVPLLLLDFRSCICILQSRYLGVLLQRLDEAELVEVTGGDDLCVLVFRENVLYAFR